MCVENTYFKMYTKLQNKLLIIQFITFSYYHLIF